MLENLIKCNNVTIISHRVNNTSKKLLKIKNKTWEKIEELTKKNFERKPVYGDDDKYIKTKIKINVGSMVANFHKRNMPREKAPCKCLSVIMLDSVIKANKKYYHQTLLEECKDEQKIENFIDDELNSDYNDETESDNGNDNVE